MSEISERMTAEKDAAVAAYGQAMESWAQSSEGTAPIYSLLTALIRSTREAVYAIDERLDAIESRNNISS